MGQRPAVKRNIIHSLLSPPAVLHLPFLRRVRKGEPEDALHEEFGNLKCRGGCGLERNFKNGLGGLMSAVRLLGPDRKKKKTVNRMS